MLEQILMDIQKADPEWNVILLRYFNPIGAHKDRHEVIGGGHIGLDALAAVTAHPALRHLPFFLETPHDKVAEYGEEIASLRAARAALL